MQRCSISLYWLVILHIGARCCDVDVIITESLIPGAGRSAFANKDYRMGDIITCNYKFMPLYASSDHTLSNVETGLLLSRFVRNADTVS